MSQKYWFAFTPKPSDSANLSPTFISFIKYDGTTLAAPGITQPITGTGLYQFTYLPTFSISFVIDGATTGGGLTTAIRYIAGSLDPIDRIDELLAEQGTTMAAIGSTLNAIGTTNVALGTTNVALGTTNVALGTTNVALGTTNVALGTTGVALGTTNVALGTTSIATTTAYGSSIVAQGVTITAIASSLAFANLVLGTTASVYGSSSTDPVDLFGYLKRIREFLEGNQTFDKSSGAWAIYSRSNATLLISKTLSNSTSGVTRT